MKPFIWILYISQTKCSYWYNTKRILTCLKKTLEIPSQSHTRKAQVFGVRVQCLWFWGFCTGEKFLLRWPNPPTRITTNNVTESCVIVGFLSFSWMNLPCYALYPFLKKTCRYSAKIYRYRFQLSPRKPRRFLTIAAKQRIRITSSFLQRQISNSSFALFDRVEERYKDFSRKSRLGLLRASFNQFLLRFVKSWQL